MKNSQLDVGVGLRKGDRPIQQADPQVDAIGSVMEALEHHCNRISHQALKAVVSNAKWMRTVILPSCNGAERVDHEAGKQGVGIWQKSRFRSNKLAP